MGKTEFQGDGVKVLRNCAFLFSANSLREDTHKTKFFLVVGLLRRGRGGGLSKEEMVETIMNHKG